MKVTLALASKVMLSQWMNWFMFVGASSGALTISTFSQHCMSFNEPLKKLPLGCGAGGAGGFLSSAFGVVGAALSADAIAVPDAESALSFAPTALFGASDFGAFGSAGFAGSGAASMSMLT